MNLFKSYIETRKKQFEQERIIDKKLEEIGKECPAIVYQYLLNARRQNRIYTEMIEEAPIYKKLDVLKRNMENIDKFQENTLDRLNNKYPCDQLNEYIGLRWY